MIIVVVVMMAIIVIIIGFFPPCVHVLKLLLYFQYCIDTIHSEIMGVHKFGLILWANL